MLRKGARGRPLSAEDVTFNKACSRTRGIVEHVFGVIKHVWGYRKVRYRGLKKNAGQLYTLLALANLYRVRKSLLAS